FYNFALRRRPSMIPTIVFRRSVASDLTFDISLQVAGEDCLFLFQLISQCRTICCSLDELVTCADGVNIYASKFSWNDPGHLVRNMGQLISFYQFRECLPLSESNDQFLRNRIRKVRKNFAFLSVRYFLKYREMWPAELVRLARRDHDFYLWYP